MEGSEIRFLTALHKLHLTEFVGTVSTITVLSSKTLGVKDLTNPRSCQVFVGLVRLRGLDLQNLLS